MLIYLYTGIDGYRRAQSDFHRRAGIAARDHDSSTASSKLAYGTEVTIVPEIDGVAFNPPSARILWLEDCQTVEFRMKVAKESRVRGRIGFYAGPLLIADLNVWLRPIGTSASTELESFATASPYRKIFVSYSHHDTTIVEQLERAYTALGDSYLRDVKILRSGETWDDALLAQIPAADIFQLCWSSAAKESHYVEREWRYALALDRQHFIRPMYWQQPMPPAPAELEHLHFTYIAADR
ncbi:MAG TPA: toll/interleukin-1 receptor domain-containing protein [Thermoanaerobaculia bacterium]|nr:toll/interleukin-1 receptor domain-containing protein [Thermoanaerobaculia bacterium]